MRLKRTIKNVFYYVLSPFVSIIPKRKIILFESISDYSDSSKVLFDEMITEKINEEYKLVWLVENINNFKELDLKNVEFIEINPSSFRKRLLKIYYYIIAKYCFYTHALIGIPFNKGQIRYFLTHAPIPIKNSTGKFWNYKYNTYIECTSDFAKKYRCMAFEGGEDRALVMGLPRNDLLFRKTDVINKMNLKKYNKKILWMPTFKHIKNNSRNDFQSDVKNDISLLNEKTLKIINKELVNTNSCLIIKFHPSQDMNFVTKYSFSNIYFYTNDDLTKMNIEVYSLLGSVDALITDFSSVYIDFLLLDKPIGFELNDKEKYTDGIGFMFKNPLEYMPGEKIYNDKDFISFVKNICNGIDEYREERKKMLNLCHKYKDGLTSRRIIKYLNLKKGETFNEKI